MKYMMTLLVVLVFSAVSFAKDSFTVPDDPSPYVEPDRFVKTFMSSRNEYIITDTSTGCQYLVIGYAGGVTSEKLGCWPKYLKK